MSSSRDGNKDKIAEQARLTAVVPTTSNYSEVVGALTKHHGELLVAQFTQSAEIAIKKNAAQIAERNATLTGKKNNGITTPEQTSSKPKNR